MHACLLRSIIDRDIICCRYLYGLKINILLSSTSYVCTVHTYHGYLAPSHGILVGYLVARVSKTVRATAKTRGALATLTRLRARVGLGI